MKVSKDEHLTQSYVLTTDDLEILCKSLQSFLSEITFEIKCSDTFTRHYSTLPELLHFENPPKKDIKSLSVKAYSQDLKTRIWIKFDKNLLRNIYFSVEGDENSAIKVNEFFEERLTAVKPWYALLTQTSFSIFLQVVLSILFNNLLLFRILDLRSFQVGSWRYHLIAVFLLSLTSIAVGVLWNRTKDIFFPMGVFALGQGAKRHRDKELIRTVVIVGFVISLASSIVVTLIFAL